MANNDVNEFFWTRVKTFRKEYKIERSGVQPLMLKRKGMLSGSASGEIDGEKIEFVSTGDFNKTITVRNTMTGKEIGSIDVNWYGNNNGVFLSSSGNEYIWKCVDFFRGQWAWFDKENNISMTFYPENLFNKSGRIKIDSADESEDNVLLTALGLHLKLFFNYWIIFAVLIIIALLNN